MKQVRARHLMVFNFLSLVSVTHMQQLLILISSKKIVLCFYDSSEALQCNALSVTKLYRVAAEALF